MKNMDYEKVKEHLNKEKFKGRYKSIYIDDSSIMFEDIVNDFYIHCVENNIDKLSDDIVKDFLKEYYSNSRKNKHYKLLDTIDYENKEYDMIEEQDIIIKQLNEIDNINLTEQEILCLLLIDNKSNYKKYNYDFIKRKCNTRIDNKKLNEQYEEIIKKLLNYIRTNINNN